MLFLDGNSDEVREYNRRKENAGKSEASWRKHEYLKDAVIGQVSAFNAKHRAPMVFIDGNAGDGVGVDHAQKTLFGSNISCTTAELLYNLADTFGADLILCEKDKSRRRFLIKRFPNAMILEDHMLAPSCIGSHHQYALWISDPNGPRDHGIDAMRRVSDNVKFTDFVIAFNEGVIASRMTSEHGIGKSEAHCRAYRTCQERYVPMMNPDWWTKSLGRRRMSRTKICKASANFKYRVMVVSDYLSSAVRGRHGFSVAV